MKLSKLLHRRINDISVWIHLNYNLVLFSNDLDTALFDFKCFKYIILFYIHLTICVSNRNAWNITFMEILKWWDSYEKWTKIDEKTLTPPNKFFVSFQIGLNSVKDKYHWYTVVWSLLRVDSCLFIPRTIVNLSYSCITQQSQQSASLSSCSKAAGDSGLKGSWFRTIYHGWVWLNMVHTLCMYRRG